MGPGAASRALRFGALPAVGTAATGAAATRVVPASAAATGDTPAGASKDGPQVLALHQLQPLELCRRQGIGARAVEEQ